MATNLNKLFVYVPSNVTNPFVYKDGEATDINAGVHKTSISADSYDAAKIYFIEASQELFVKGKFYGLNLSADLNALKDKVDVLLKDADVDFDTLKEISDWIKSGDADHIKDLASRVQTLEDKVGSDGYTISNTATKVSDSAVTLPEGTKYSLDGKTVLTAGEGGATIEAVSSYYTVTEGESTGLYKYVDDAIENADVSGKINDEIDKLDSSVYSVGSDDDDYEADTDSKVKVKVVETDGKLTSVSVDTNDIASASDLSDLSDKVGHEASGTAAVAATITDGVTLYDSEGNEVSADKIVAGTTYYTDAKDATEATEAKAGKDYTEPVAASEDYQAATGLYDELSGLYDELSKVKKQAAGDSSLSKDITVAGGPLADDSTDNWPSDWTSGGNRIIPSGSTLEDIIEKLFLKTVNGTISINYSTKYPTISNPIASLSTTGSVAVGTVITVSDLDTNSTVTDGYMKASLTANQGYFEGTSTTWNSVASGKSVGTTSGSHTGTATISSYVNQGIGTVSNSDTFVVGAASTYILTVQQTGVSYTISGNFANNTTYYASTNTKSKLSDSATITDQTDVTGNLESTTTKSVTGYFPIFYGNLTNTKMTNDDWTSELMTSKNSGASAPTSITAEEGEGTFFIALPEGNANYSASSWEVMNSTTKALLGAGVRTDDLTHTLYSNAEDSSKNITKKYHIFYISNDAGWVGETAFDSITFKA